MRSLSGCLLFASIAACSSQRASVAPSGYSHPQSMLPFIEDDYPRALTQARAKHVPIFVETWAPW